ncbi:MAG: universal stress protein [Leptolyngbyaceae cyanobacterium MO_188.B28]|nr:universal stress protein [Leptolyngbyaceae cyanobacterium MO_188.B28]
MYKKILAAMDHSPMGQTVFDRALSLAKTNQADLMLLHVLSGEEENSPLPMPALAGEVYWAPGAEVDLERWHEQWARYESECLETLQTFASKANQIGVTTEFRQVAGSSGRTICQIARTWGANLIVIGNRGRSGLSELVLGSVSNYVLHHAPCSVLILKSSSEENTE